MEDTSRLYDTLVGVLRQHRQWQDVRHLQTLVWMIVGLLQSGLISLNQWAPFVLGRAEFAQSTVRRFARWLNNERIVVHHLYGPLIQQCVPGPADPGGEPIAHRLPRGVPGRPRLC